MTPYLKKAYRDVNKELRKVGEEDTRFTPCGKHHDCVAVQILHECHPARPDQGSSCRWDFPSELEAARFLEGYAACLEWTMPAADTTLRREDRILNTSGKPLPPDRYKCVVAYARIVKDDPKTTEEILKAQYGDEFPEDDPADVKPEVGRAACFRCGEVLTKAECESVPLRACNDCHETMEEGR
jgi:hypothetical protein